MGLKFREEDWIGGTNLESSAQREHFKCMKLMRLPKEYIDTVKRKALGGEPWDIVILRCQGDDEEELNTKGAGNQEAEARKVSRRPGE